MSLVSKTFGHDQFFLMSVFYDIQGDPMVLPHILEK